MLKINKTLILALLIGTLFMQIGYCEDDDKYVLMYSDPNTKIYVDSTTIHKRMIDLIPEQPFLVYDVWTKWTYSEEGAQGYINKLKMSGQSIEGYEKYSYSLMHSIYGLSPAMKGKQGHSVAKDVEILDYDIEGNILARKTYAPRYYELKFNTIGYVILINTSGYCLEHHIL